MVKYEDNQPEKWYIKEHTKVKHEILKLYLRPWGKILGSRNKRLIILDGFAGRGEYFENGQTVVCGSPMIFMDLNTNFLIEELICICIEKNVENYDNLSKVLKEKKNELTKKNSNLLLEIIELKKIHNTNIDLLIEHIPQKKYNSSNEKQSSQKTSVILINDEFSNVIELLLDNISTNKVTLAPLFCFIDPFGFRGIPLNIIKKILSLPYTEVLFTFMARDINRFHALKQEEQSLAELFGNKEWKKAIKKKGEESFLYFYKKTLKDNGIKFVIYFKMFESNRMGVIYYLIHASNNLKAVELMKERMKRISMDFTYFGPDNNKLGNEQIRLTYGYDEFGNNLCEVYRGKNVTFDKLREQTIDSNSFIEKEYRAIIKKLEKEKKVVITRIDSVKSGLKRNDIINFLS